MNPSVLRAARTLSAGVIGVLASLSSLPVLADGSLKLSTGYEYTSGKYGQNVDTEIVYVPVTLRYIKDAWSYKVTVPYISVTGNGAVVPGTGGSVSSGNFNTGFFGGGGMGGGGAASSTQTVTNAGLGDVTASIAYAFFPTEAFYEVSAKVKFATADADKGLGTGENDYYLQFDGFIGTGTVTPFFTLGYVVTGDSANFTLKDVPYGSAGLMFKTSASSSLGVSYDYQQSTFTGNDDLSQATAFISWKTSPQWSAGLTATVGFSDSSPDSGFGVNLSRHY